MKDRGSQIVGRKSRGFEGREKLSISTADIIKKIGNNESFFDESRVNIPSWTG